jgi:sortase A
MKKRKILSTLIILAGIGIILYPFLSEQYTAYWQNKLLGELETSASQDAQDNYMALDALFEAGEDENAAAEAEAALEAYDATASDTEASSGETTETDTTAATKPYIPIQAIGKITIPKIDLTMAILEGSSATNLNRGAAHISGTSAFGEVGNVGIAGHRGRSYGIMFNRLDEMEKGDLIEITSGGVTYTYEVYETKIVEPTDMTVLYRNNIDKVLTLVTCDPVHNPTHRLIVHAVLKE